MTDNIDIPSPEFITNETGIKIISTNSHFVKEIKDTRHHIHGTYILIIDSGEKYVGLSTDLFDRLKQHLYSRTKMNRTVIAHFYETDIDDMSILEKWLIYKLEPELNKLYPNIKEYRTKPQSHCCAFCKNRPIDFCKSPERINPESLFKYRNDIEDDEYLEILMSEDKYRMESLKIYRKCPKFKWLKMAPFKNNNYDCFVNDCEKL